MVSSREQPHNGRQRRSALDLHRAMLSPGAHPAGGKPAATISDTAFGRGVEAVLERRATPPEQVILQPVRRRPGSTRVSISTMAASFSSSRLCQYRLQLLVLLLLAGIDTRRSAPVDRLEFLHERNDSAMHVARRILQFLDRFVVTFVGHWRTRAEKLMGLFWCCQRIARRLSPACDDYRRGTRVKPAAPRCVQASLAGGCQRGLQGTGYRPGLALAHHADDAVQRRRKFRSPSRAPHRTSDRAAPPGALWPAATVAADAVLGQQSAQNKPQRLVIGVLRAGRRGTGL